MMAPNPSTTLTTPAPTTATATTTATMVVAPVAAHTTTYATSRAVEFDKGRQRPSSDYAKFQNCVQLQKWHRTLMGSACEHKCEQVLDPSHAPNPSNPDKISLT